MSDYFILSIQDKLNRYRKRYQTQPEKIKQHLFWWLLKQMFSSNKKPKSRQGEVRVCFYLCGGLGDILISLNYLYCFYKRFPSVILCLTVEKRFFNAVSVYLRGSNLTVRLESGNKPAEGDLQIFLIRVPVLVYADGSRLRQIPKLNDWLLSIKTFNQNYPEYLLSGTFSDFLLEKYSCMYNRVRLNEADIDDFLHVKTAFEIRIPEKDALKKYGLEAGKYITMQRGVGLVDEIKEEYQTRLWPLENYERLAVMLKERYGLPIVQIGEECCKKIENVTFHLCGKTDFSEMLQILQQAALHVDGECGMVHMRHFMGKKPSVVLFGPTNEKFFGYPENLNISNRSCPFACEWLHENWREKCLNGSASCMKNITPEMVLEQIEKNALIKFEGE